MSPVRLHYRVDGPEDGPTVVLGPSLGTDLEMFTYQVAALREQWRVIRFDLRGHGGSEVVPGSYTVADLATDLLALLSGLGIERFSYVGVSIGGAIGQWLGAYHSDRLDRLVICASAARFPDPESWPVRAERVRSDGTEWLVESRYGAWFTHEFAAASPATAKWLLEMLRSTPAEGYAGCCAAIAAFDLRAQLSGISVPTRVIAGAEDPATPARVCQEIADGIERADLIVVPGASHLVNVEKPEPVNSAIIAHLNGSGDGS